MSTQTAAKSALSQVVAANIRAEAARRGWRQSDMAQRLGWSRVAISDRYRGRTPWALDELELVAALFGVEVADLVARPKGFEPLTFWLGADHSITLYHDEAEALWFGWCDLCGYGTNHRERPRLAPLMDEHAILDHDLYMERVA